MLPLNIREQITDWLVRVIAPLSVFAGIVAIVLSLITAPGQLHRIIPPALIIVLITPAWLLVRAGRPRYAAPIIILCLTVPILSGMLFSGGVRAPVFIGVLPLITIVYCLYGQMKAVLFAMLTLIVGGVFVILESKQILPYSPQPPAALVLVVYGVWLVCAVIFIAAPVKLMFNALKDSEKQRLETENEISKRKAALKKLQESEERYRLLAENVDDVIWMSDLSFNWIYISPSFEKLTGYSSEEAVKIPMQEMITPDSAENAATILMEELGKLNGPQRENTSKILEVEFYCKDGSTVWSEINVNFQWDKDGNPIGLLGVTRNIEDRKMAEREKAKLENQLSRAKKMEALGELAGGVAHDLNNVLSGIVSYPDLLLMDLPKDSPLSEPLLTIQDSGKKAAAIVQDLLTLTRRGVVTEEVVNLNSIISDYLKSPEHQKLKSYNPVVAVETNLESDLLNITGSSVHLAKTVMNLVSNAVEAIPDRGKISRSTENIYIDRPLSGYDGIEEGDYVTLVVSDTGVGISSEDRERIFEPFFTRKVMGRSGTGLGMAVVWGTVKDHNGEIDVHSIKGKGTTFTLYFPATRRTQAKELDALPIERYMGNGESILVVDDSIKQREIASNLLKALGYVVATVSSGEEAVNYIKENTVDLLILDMIMDPGIDGLETYKKIIAIKPQQKAIIASGFSETARVGEAQKLGAGPYIKKPYTLEKIGTAVKRELKALK